MKQKTNKTISKRFKISSKGKMFKKNVQTSHLKRKDDTSSKFRKKKLSLLSKGFSKKFKKLV